MAVNIHIKLDEIEGEASDPKFPKAITVWDITGRCPNPPMPTSSMQARRRRT